MRGPRKIATDLSRLEPRRRAAVPAACLPLIIVLLVLSGCNSTKWVPPGERLLVRNVIDVDKGTLDPEELQRVLKQKPNKRVLGRAIYLDLYNLRDPAKVVRKRALKDSLCLIDNEERQAQGKKPKECEHSTRGRNGEPPVILDTTLTQRAVDQLHMYAAKEGYFDAHVSDTVRYTRRLLWPWKGWGRKPFSKPKAAVEYVVRAGRPWTICTVDMRVDDPVLVAYLMEEWDKSLLKPGDRFDADVVDEERSRITAQMRILGLLYFTRDMVIFDADTSAGDHEVDLVLRLERPLARSQRGLKGTPEGRVYHVNDVIIDATMHTAENAALPYDTVYYDGFTVLYKGQVPEIQPRSLAGTVLLKPDTRFNQNDADRTFRRLSNLRVFDRVEITYDTIGLPRNDLANARIRLLPAMRQSFSVEGSVTNRGGALGTSGSFNYRHKNMFRTMASLQFSLVLGVEAQQKLSPDTDSEDASTDLGRNALFNTVEIGPEMSLRFPMRWGSAKSGGSRLVVNSLFNYQRRPDYTRTLAKGSLGAEVNLTGSQLMEFYPLEVNVVRIPEQSPEFTEFLLEANDPVLTNSYTDHIITGMRGVWSTNNRLTTKDLRNIHSIRVSGELAGTTIMGLVPVSLLSEKVTDPTTGETYGTIADVRYAQFLKLEFDYRHHRKLHDRSTMAFRLAAGGAEPFGNLDVLPFESGFFGGGANGIRAWRARSLGPGAYSSTTNSFDRIGEMRLEGNVEYRFQLFGYLEGALFADAGNIWFRHANPAKPGGEFKPDRFLGEIAVGTGIGARLNFDFFLVRFDLALQTKDPGLPEGQRWIYQKKDPGLETRFGQKLNFNLGIGYPF